MYKNASHKLWESVIELDPVVQFLGMLVRARWFIWVGALVGLCAGLLYVEKRSPVYTTVVSVTVDARSLPAAESVEGVLAKFAVALRLVDCAKVAMTSLMNDAPVFKTNMELDKHVHQVLSQQTSLENDAGWLRMPLRVTRGASSPKGGGEKSFDYFVTAQLPVVGLPSNVGPVLVNALNSAIDVYNTREKARHTARGTLASMDPVLTYLPRFLANPLDPVSFEQPRSRLLPILGCTVLGAVLAFYGLVVVVFVRDNKNRIKEVARQGFGEVLK